MTEFPRWITLALPSAKPPPLASDERETEELVTEQLRRELRDAVERDAALEREPAK